MMDGMCQIQSHAELNRLSYTRTQPTTALVIEAYPEFFARTR
jgi:hypothetical protein